MLLDLIDLSKLRRAILYALLLAVIFAFQDLLLVHIPLLGVRALVIPAAVIAVGMFEGGAWGGVIGMAAGYFLDLGYTESLVFFTVTLTVIGFFTGVLGKFVLHRGFVTFLFLVLTALVLLTLLQMTRFLFFTETVSVRAVWRTGILQVLWSLPWSMVLYPPCKAVAARTLSSQ